LYSNPQQNEQFVVDLLYNNLTCDQHNKRGDASDRRVAALVVLITSPTTCQDVVSLLYNLLHNKFITNRSNGVCAWRRTLRIWKRAAKHASIVHLRMLKSASKRTHAEVANWCWNA